MPKNVLLLDITAPTKCAILYPDLKQLPLPVLESTQDVFVLHNLTYWYLFVIPHTRHLPNSYQTISQFGPIRTSTYYTYSLLH